MLLEMAKPPERAKQIFFLKIVFVGLSSAFEIFVVPAPWMRELLLAMATSSLKPHNLCNFQILQNTNQHLQEEMIQNNDLPKSNT